MWFHTVDKNERSCFFGGMEKGARTRQAILERATNLASVVGLDGLSIGKLASHTGLSKSGLFGHFGSKENLQVETLKAASELFKELVVLPALQVERGLPRLEELFTRWLAWDTNEGLSGGCIFITASAELDDKPGPARDYLVKRWVDWNEVIRRIAAGAVERADFRSDLDCTQFAYDLNNIFFGFQHTGRLLGHADAEQHARNSFERLIEDARE